jgi:protein-arginine kinase activator protein McsA
MPTSFCTLEEAWGTDIKEQSPISRVESVIDPVSSEKEYGNLTPNINFNSPFEKTNKSEPIVKQCDICSLVLEQLKNCPDCLDKFRKMLLPAYNETNKQQKNKIPQKQVKKEKIPEKIIDNSDDYESDDEIPTMNIENNTLSTDRIIIYILIGIIIVLLIFELYMSFNRKSSVSLPQPQMIQQPYYGNSSNMLHL